MSTWNAAWCVSWTPRTGTSDRFRKINAAGGVSAYTVKEQWERVIEWNAFLESDQRSDYPVLEGFDIAWEQLDDIYKLEDKSIIERGIDLQRVSDTPLSSLFYFIDMGFYPPPELMLALLDCWDVYIANGGKISLEEAFIGPARKGIGNFAARTRSKYKSMHLRWEFDRMLREGMTRAEIAEELSNRMGGKPCSLSARGRNKAKPPGLPPQPVRQDRTRDATEWVAQAKRGVGQG